MNYKTCSVVMTDRNDDYKDKERVKYCMASACDIFDEIWFIDWNTPKGKEPLLHSIRDSFDGQGKVRHLIVNEDMAKELTSGRKSSVGIPDVLCRNIAIRRTNCDFLVSSAGIDIFGPVRSNFLTMLDNLELDTFYTLSRRELVSDVLYRCGIDRWKEALENFSNISEPRKFMGGCTPNDWYSIINCCGDFQIAATKLWLDIKGFEEKMELRCFSDTNVQKKAILNRYKVEALFEPAVFHISHEYGSMESERNDPMKWVENFVKSENSDTWGFSDRDFEIEIM